MCTKFTCILCWKQSVCLPVPEGKGLRWAVCHLINNKIKGLSNNFVHKTLCSWWVWVRIQLYAQGYPKWFPHWGCRTQLKKTAGSTAVFPTVLSHGWSCRNVPSGMDLYLYAAYEDKKIKTEMAMSAQGAVLSGVFSQECRSIMCLVILLRLETTCPPSINWCTASTPSRYNCCLSL